MNIKHSPEQKIARLISSAIEEETPDVRQRIMESVAGRAQDTGGHRARPAKIPVYKYAAAFAAVCLVAGAAYLLPQGIGHGAAPISPGASQGASAAKAQNRFSLVTYAAEIDQKPEELNKEFGISLLRPISVTGKDLSAFQRTVDGSSIYRDLDVIKQQGDTLTYAAYAGFNLKCVGENIRSVTYTAQRGGFAQIVPLTEGEADSRIGNNPYYVEKERENFELYKDEILKKDPNYKVPEPDPNYGNGSTLENGGNWGFEKDDMEYYGYLPIGSSFTVAYDEQDDYTKQYACRLLLSYTEEEVKQMDETSIKEIFHRSFAQMDGLKITAKATFEDGSTAEKQLVLRYDTDSWNIKAFEAAN